MIPKIIHYCWLSNDPIPQKLQNYMQSWKQKLPDYELILWNFNRFDKESCIWVKQAFESKKYAFAADYIRLFALYNYGGIYLDMDVEVIKKFDDLLELKTFMCWQHDAPGLEVAAMGAEKYAPWLKICLDRYENRPFINGTGFDMKTLPCVVEDVLREKQIRFQTVQNIEIAKEYEKECMPVFTWDFFSPKSLETGIVSVTSNTYCIHHFSGSWCNKRKRVRGLIYYFLYQHLGESFAKFIRKIFGRRK